MPTTARSRTKTKPARKARVAGHRHSAARAARQTGASGVKGTRSRRTKDAIALLRADHEEVSSLFERYEKGKDRFDAARKSGIAEQICRALDVHARIEEEIFYPACRSEVEGAEDLLAEAEVEHGSLKELIAKIGANQPGTDEYDALVKVLGEYVKHHVKEEHDELFPKVRKSRLDTASLGAALAERKAELTGNAPQG